jgi:hypothetical protein
MGALLPVFGLLVLTIEWTVLRQVAPRLRGRSVTRRALLGAAAGFGTWALVTLLGLVAALLVHLLGLPEDAQVLATATFYLLLFGGILIVPVAAGFGAALLAAERYRVPSHE